MLRRLNAVLWLLWLLWLLLSLPLLAEPVRLFLVHTNDIHGHLEATDDGGLVRAATVVRALKESFPGRVLLLDAGDTALGTPVSGLFHGLPTADLVQAMGYDALALGNHEFNWGQEAMAAMLARHGLPTVCANLRRASDGQRVLPASVVLERGSARVGIIGLVTPDTASRAPAEATSGWTFQEAEAACREALQELGPVDAVIALSHLGEGPDRALARAVPELDLIVGGHSHSALHEVVWEAGVPIVQAGAYARYLGVLELEIDPDAPGLRVVSSRLLPLDARIAPDPEAERLVEAYAAQVRPLLDRVVAEVTAPIANRPADDGSRDRPLGNLIAEMLRRQSGSDLGLYNRGGVRGELRAGPLTVRQVHQMFPFDDPVVVLEVTPTQLAAVIRQGMETQAQVSVAGLEAVLDERGQVQLSRNGQPLTDQGPPLTLATTHFLATGGDGMASLLGLPRRARLGYTRDVVLQDLAEWPLLSPPTSGRLRWLLPERPAQPEDRGTVRLPSP